MAEAADTVLALSAKDIPTRAAAARELGANGGVAHVERLLSLAIGDPSQGVRLSSATAAADILSRHRLPPRRDDITAEQRDAWLRTVSGVDPGLNTALFQVVAALDTPAAVQRVLTGLRDPRHDARAGACVGLWRLLQCGLRNGDTELEARVVKVLEDSKLRIETRVEIARICSCVGYSSARAAAEGMAGEAIRHTKEVVDQVVARFVAPPPVVGLWVDDGTDADEAAAKRKPVALIAILGTNEAIRVAGTSVERTANLGTMRTLSTRRDGDPILAVQVGTRTFWAADGDDLCAFADALISAGHCDWLDAADGVVGTTSAGLRVRGVRYLSEGKLTAAIEALEAAIAGKKVPADTWWHYADALARAGRAAEARPHLEKFLSKAAKRAPFVEEAKQRLA